MFLALALSRTAYGVCPTGSAGRVSVVFVNGIHTSFLDGDDALMELRGLVDQVIDQGGTPLTKGCVLMFFEHNPTAGYIADLKESVQGASLSETSKWKYLFGILTPLTISNPLTKLQQFLARELEGQVVDRIATLSSQTIAAGGLILVGHSQGTFYVNRVYQDRLTPAERLRTRALAIATPADHVPGSNDRRVTLDGDIITSVPGALGGNVPNAECNASIGARLLCHYLVESYLARGDTRAAIRTQLRNAILALVPNPPSVSVPTPLSPVGISIPQNDSSIGCPFDAITGYGHRITFDWADSSSVNGIAGYELFAKKNTAVFPIVNTFVTTSNFSFTSCNAYVIDSNLTGWQWRVRARDTLGNFSAWTALQTFQFSPCRLPGGIVCGSAPSPSPIQWLSLVEGNPLIPGDGVLVSALGGEFNFTFDLQTRFSLGQSTEGLTVTTFPSPNLGFQNMSFVIVNSAQTTSGPCVLHIGMGTTPTGTTQVNGVTGYYQNIYQSQLISVLDFANQTHPGCNFTLSDLAIGGFYLVTGVPGQFIESVDAVAIGVGLNRLPILP